MKECDSLFIKIYAAAAAAADILICALGAVREFSDIWIPVVLFMAFFIGLSLLHLTVTFIMSLFIKLDKPCDVPDKFCRFWVFGTVGFVLDLARVRITVNGAEKLPHDRRFLLVSNHRSNLDPMIGIVKFYKNEIAYVAKPEVLKFPIVGPFIHKCCFLPIDRENARNAMRTIHRATDFVKNDITSIGIYPEGTRSKTGELLEFKDGVFYIAKKAPCPVAVITVKGTENLSKNLPFKSTKVLINVLGVIEPEEFADLSTHELGEKVREMMLADLGK